VAVSVAERAHQRGSRGLNGEKALALGSGHSSAGCAMENSVEARVIDARLAERVLEIGVEILLALEEDFLARRKIDDEDGPCVLVPPFATAVPRPSTMIGPRRSPCFPLSARSPSDTV